MNDMEVLYKALNAACPEKEQWIQGRDAYLAALQAGEEVERAFYDALDAAPDEAYWHAGRTVLVVHGRLTTEPHETINLRKAGRRAVDSLKSLIGSKLHKEGGAQ